MSPLVEKNLQDSQVLTVLVTPGNFACMCMCVHTHAISNDAEAQPSDALRCAFEMFFFFI